MEIEQIEDAMEQLLAAHGFDDWSLHLDTATSCAWAAEITVTLHAGGAGDPDQRHVTRAVGGVRAEDAATDAYSGLLQWLQQDGRLRGG
jgi:hypothetical protein